MWQLKVAVAVCLKLLLLPATATKTMLSARPLKPYRSRI